MPSGSANTGGLGKSGDQGRPEPICLRCGKKGHLSRNCTHVPTAKSLRTATDSADVIFDMAPWAAEFAEWRARQDQPATAEEPSEDVNTLKETQGCAIRESGATVMCSSTVAAEEIQMQRLRQNEPGAPSVGDSDRCFRFADGRTDEAQQMVKQPITAGLLQGKSINMHWIDRAGNEPALCSVSMTRDATGW